MVTPLAGRLRRLLLLVAMVAAWQLTRANPSFDFEDMHDLYEEEEEEKFALFDADLDEVEDDHVVPATVAGLIARKRIERIVRFLDSDGLDLGSTPGDAVKASDSGSSHAKRIRLPRGPTEQERDMELLRLNGTCWTATDEEGRYLYQLCPFQNVTRLNLRFQSTPTLLGLWGSWRSPSTMLLDDGVECSLGRRQAEVELICPDLSLPLERTHTRLLEPHDVNFCKSAMRLRSPLACSLPGIVPTIECTSQTTSALAAAQAQVAAFAQVEAAVLDHFLEFVLPGLRPWAESLGTAFDVLRAYGASLAPKHDQNHQDGGSS